MQVTDDVVLARSDKSKKLKRVTQQNVMREHFNALIEKQDNLKLKRKKLELAILLLEKKHVKRKLNRYGMLVSRNVIQGSVHNLLGGGG